MVSDQRMPIMLGSKLLAQAREISPNTMRLLLTGYSDLQAIVDSVNEGEIFRYINKPWDNDDLQKTIQQAADIALSLVDINQTEIVPLEYANSAGILVIDDDQSTYNIVKKISKQRFPVYWGKNLDELFDLLSKHEIAVVVTEVKLTGQSISAALKALKQFHPDILAIILTSFQDTDALIQLINEGQIYKFLPKPILEGLLEKSIESALKHVNTLQAKPALLKRHQVEQPKVATEAKESNRLMGYIRKIRRKIITSV
jgi:serine/threonine-protein kinase